MNKLRALIQQENEKGEFETIATNETFTGVIYNGDKIDYIVSAKFERMCQTSGILMGYARGYDVGRQEIRLHKIEKEVQTDAK